MVIKLALSTNFLTNKPIIYELAFSILRVAALEVERFSRRVIYNSGEERVDYCIAFIIYLCKYSIYVFIDRI